MTPEEQRHQDLAFALGKECQRVKAAKLAARPPPPPPPTETTPAQEWVMNTTASERDEIYVSTLVATGSVAAASAVCTVPHDASRYGKLPGSLRERAISPEVKDLVKAANLAKVQAANITAQRVMQELGRIAFSDIRRVFTSTGDLKPIHELDDDTAAAIASVDSETRREGRGEDATPVTTKKVRTVDKMAALSLLAKHFKIVGDEGDGVNALASALADRLDRAHRRVNAGMDAVEDAVMVQPQEVTYDPPATNLNLNPNPQPTNPNQEYDDEEPLG